MCGYSGHALRVAKWAFRLGGVRRWARRMADAGSVEEQGRIWDEHLRPVLLAPWIARLFLANPSVLLFFSGLCVADWVDVYVCVTGCFCGTRLGCL